MKNRKVWIICAVYAAMLALVVSLSSCMTPRQVDALQLVNDAERDGRISSEEATRIREGLDPNRWIYDIMLLLGGIAGGGVTGGAVTKRRLGKAS